MELILDSGAKLVITVAPFQDAHGLLKAILRSVKGTDIANVDIPDSLEKMRNNLQALSPLIDKVLSIATSDDVEVALFKCFQRVSYNDLKITRDLLDDPKIGDQLRQDYYTICYRVIEENCKPFFVRTFSGLRASPQTPDVSQK